MKYIRIITFLIMIGLVLFANRIFGTETIVRSNIPVVVFNDSEAVVITAKVRHHKKHGPVWIKNHRQNKEKRYE